MGLVIGCYGMAAITAQIISTISLGRQGAPLQDFVAAALLAGVCGALGCAALTRRGILGCLAWLTLGLLMAAEAADESYSLHQNLNDADGIVITLWGAMFVSIIVAVHVEGFDRRIRRLVLLPAIVHALAALSDATDGGSFHLAIYSFPVAEWITQTLDVIAAPAYTAVLFYMGTILALDRLYGFNARLIPDTSIKPSHVPSISFRQSIPDPRRPYAKVRNRFPLPAGQIEKSPRLPKPARSGKDYGLVAQNLTKSFKGNLAVSRLSVAVRGGEAVGLLGPNGAGKTTAFYMIAGLVPSDQGIVTLDGADITRLPLHRRARLGISYLSQEPSVFRSLTVEQNIRAALEVAISGRAEREQMLHRLLEEFQIADLADVQAVALSGGERRRVEIARAMATRPRFMLLDEPFAGVDPIALGEVCNLVRQLTAQGVGLLITDHNVRETLKIIDRGCVLREGHLLAEGSPEEIVADPDARRLYLGEAFSCS